VYGPPGTGPLKDRRCASRAEPCTSRPPVGQRRDRPVELVHSGLRRGPALNVAPKDQGGPLMQTAIRCGRLPWPGIRFRVAPPLNSRTMAAGGSRADGARGHVGARRAGVSGDGRGLSLAPDTRGRRTSGRSSRQRCRRSRSGRASTRACLSTAPGPPTSCSTTTGAPQRPTRTRCATSSAGSSIAPPRARHRLPRRRTQARAAPSAATSQRGNHDFDGPVPLGIGNELFVIERRFPDVFPATGSASGTSDSNVFEWSSSDGGVT
jgi:hypothetical protein